jgi:putative membrane protein
VRAWVVVVALIVGAANQVGSDWDDFGELGRGLPLELGLLAIGAVLLAILGATFLSWRQARFRVLGDAVESVTGVVFRRRKRVRLDRLQAVDTVHPLLGRIFGLAELRLESAGGADSRLTLAYLREDDAADLRAELLARAAGLATARTVPSAPAAPTGQPPTAPTGQPPAAPTGQPPAAPAPSSPGPTGPPPQRLPGAPARLEAPETILLEVSPGRVIGAFLRSGAAVSVGISLAVVAAVAIFAREELFAVAIPVIVGTGGTVVWPRLAGDIGFTLAASPDGLRLRHGLTAKVSQTVPPGRVQAIRARQGLLWRAKGWWRLDMNVAGYGSADVAEVTTLLPVGNLEEVHRALWAVLPALGQPAARAALAAAFEAPGRPAGFTCAPRAARVLDPIGWRRRAHVATATALVVRSGFWTREVVWVPHERTQGLAVSQGPIQRRLGLGSVVVASTEGPVRPRVDHLSAPDAAALLVDQARRAREARAAAGPVRWMSLSGGGR